jgi:hypothetical protein
MSFRAVGHCDKFGFALWATAAKLVMRYGQLRRSWLCAKDHFGRSGYSLWISVRNEAVLLKSGTISALSAIAKELIMRYGP